MEFNSDLKILLVLIEQKWKFNLHDHGEVHLC